MILARTIRHAPYIGYHHRDHPFHKTPDTVECEGVKTKSISPLSLNIYQFQAHTAFHISYFRCEDDIAENAW